MEIKVKILDKRAVMPAYGSAGAAGADLRALLDSDLEIVPGETVMVQTGLAVAIPEGYAGLVCARSGLALKRGLAPANKVGVIDSDYRGELTVAIHNHSAITTAILPGERIAQLLIVPVAAASFVPSESLDETERGVGGFGSTGRL